MLTGYTSADMQHLVYNMNFPQSPFGGFMQPVQSSLYGFMQPVQSPPYGFMQPVQSPPYGSQFQTASATPPWATDIIEDLKKY